MRENSLVKHAVLPLKQNFSGEIISFLNFVHTSFADSAAITENYSLRITIDFEILRNEFR